MKHERHAHPENQLDAHAHHGEDRGIEQRLTEYRVVEHERVVAESGPTPGLNQRGVMKAQPDRPQDGDARHRKDHHQRGRHHRPRGATLTAAERAAADDLYVRVVKARVATRASSRRGDVRGGAHRSVTSTTTPSCPASGRTPESWVPVGRVLVESSTVPRSMIRSSRGWSVRFSAMSLHSLSVVRV